MIRPLALALVLLVPAAPPVQAETPVVALLPFPAPAAARQISVTVDRGLTRTASLPTPALRQARVDMLAGIAIPDADLRALADRRDGRAAQDYVRRLVSQGTGTPSDIAWYGSIAVASGRVWTLPETVGAMLALDPATEPPERVKAHMAMLYPHAWAGNALAQDALIALNGPGRLFGPMSDKTRARLLEMDRKAGDGRVALQLAMAALRAPADREVARTCLQAAQGSSHLAIRTAAAALLAGLDAPPPAVTQ
jgi:hypothetical protein